MKIKTITLSLIIFNYLYADIIISTDSLPQNSKDFLKQNFNAAISLAQRDRNSYEVHLSDGTDIEFDIDGNWHEIENKINPFNFNFLPKNLESIIKSEFPNIKAREIEKKINHYKIKLTNGMKIYIDFNGTILYKEMDN